MININPLEVLGFLFLWAATDVGRFTKPFKMKHWIVKAILVSIGVFLIKKYS
jgi:hypothetical protein